MKSRFLSLWIFALAFPALAAAAAANTGGVGAVLVSNGAGIDPLTVGTMRGLTVQQFRQQGVRMVDGPALEGIQPVDATTGGKVGQLGANRLFVLNLGRLGQKVILTLDERTPDGQQVVTSAALQTEDVEETDRILPRLVSAVLHRESAESNAEYATVTSSEGRDVNKRPGERFFAIGLPFGIVSNKAGGAIGLSLAFMYEAESFRIDFTGLGVGGGGGGAGLLGIGGYYLFLPGDITPYLGGGVGYMGISRGDSSGGGGGFTAEGGVEFFRTRRVRLIAGVEALLPAYKNGDNSYTPYYLLHTRIAF